MGQVCMDKAEQRKDVLRGKSTSAYDMGKMAKGAVDV